jgi:FKBP-type peptidyl-prolyl cis-trans isomerase SlyD
MSIQVISFNCLLKNRTGQLISSTYNSEVITAINDDQSMLLGLAKGLQNLKKGETRSISLMAQDAYGFYDPQKVILYPKNKLAKLISIGDQVAIKGKSGMMRFYKIIQFHDDMVSLDGNHPLAGQDLIFEIEALSARDATREEINQSQNVISSQMLH